MPHALVLLLLAAALPRAAAMTLEHVTLKGTFECVGVRAVYSGDEDADGSVAVRYREKGAPEWREGHPLIRIPKNRFVTSLFWLREGTTYEIELLPSDPEGARVAFPQPLEVTTRSSAVPAPGRGLWVDAAAEAGGDGSRNAPFRTIQDAAAAAQPGDTVHILPGTYREEVRPALSGTPDAWIRFAGEGPGVFLDGGETVDTTTGWTALGGGVYSRPFDRSPKYACLDDVRLYRHSSLANLRDGGDGIEGGFFVERGTLYVKAPGGGPLQGRLLRTGRRGYGFYLENLAYIEIRGLEIGYYDEMGVRLRGTHHAIVRECFVHHSRQMIYVEREASTDNLIEGNRIWGTGVPDWPWEICHHGHDCSSNGVYITRAGEGNVVRRNQISGTYNGIYNGGWVEDYPEEWALENDIYDNLLEVIKDDAIEPECHAINLRIFGNVMRNLFVAVSLAPIETGPAWVLYNVVHHARPHDKGRGQWIKIAVTPRGTIPMGEVRVYHNTAYYDDPGHNGWNSVGSGNTHFLNNIVHATRYVFENTRPEPYPPGNRWDYNNLYTVDASRYVKWENRTLDPQGFRALGFEQHGISAPPRFLDAAGGDFRLAPDDPGIDKGLHLPGINDGFQGAAPDLGAFEFVN